MLMNTLGQKYFFSVTKLMTVPLLYQFLSLLTSIFASSIRSCLMSLLVFLDCYYPSHNSLSFPIPKPLLLLLLLLIALGIYSCVCTGGWATRVLVWHRTTSRRRNCLVALVCRANWHSDRRWETGIRLMLPLGESSPKESRETGGCWREGGKAVGIRGWATDEHEGLNQRKHLLS